MLLALSSETLPLTVVNDYADNIVAQQLSQVDGVALVLIAGAQKPAVRVEANPVALAGRGLSLEDVRAAIATATLDAPKGSLDGARRGYTIENNDQLFTAATPDPAQGAARHSGLARCRDGPTDCRTNRASRDQSRRGFAPRRRDASH
jgi:multidrug efflux pump subunit AcrB